MESVLKSLSDGLRVRVRSSQDGWVERETRVKTVKQVEKKPMVLLTTWGGEYKIKYESEKRSYHLIDLIDDQNLGELEEISLIQE